jgi:hypothetical protein
MNWIFQNDLMRRLQGDSEFPFAAFSFIKTDGARIRLSRIS